LGYLPRSSSVGEEQEEKPSIPNTDQPLPLSIVKKKKATIRTASGQNDMSGSPGEERVISISKRRVRKQLSCRGAASPNTSLYKIRRIKPERSFMTNSSTPGSSSLAASSVPSIRCPGWTITRGTLDPLGELRGTSFPRLDSHAPLGEFGYDADVSSSAGVLDKRVRVVPVLVAEVKVTPELKVLSDNETTV
jgi:hypothetical protein